MSDPRCPHDAWVKSLTIREPAIGARQERRQLELHVRLLGAYHNGHIELVYHDVYCYTLTAPAKDENTQRRDIGHGDWLIDEIRLSEDERVVYEVQLERGYWLIECADLEYRWHPL